MPLPFLVWGAAAAVSAFVGSAAVAAAIETMSESSKKQTIENDDDFDYEAEIAAERERRKSAEKRRIQSAATEAVNNALQTILLSIQPNKLSKPHFKKLRSFATKPLITPALDANGSSAGWLGSGLDRKATNTSNLTAAVLSLDVHEREAYASYIYSVEQLGDLICLKSSNRLQADLSQITRLKKEIDSLHQLSEMASRHAGV